MKKINIIQFLPYFPPHKWGLETHAMQWWEWWVKKWYWDVFNVTTHFDQENLEWENIIFNWICIWYKKEWVYNLIVPSFEIVKNFPIYKIWSKDFRLILKFLSEKNINIVITRTRFFLTSFIWWIYAKKNNLKWCHIEHGSDYVKLDSSLKNFVAKIFDKTIWKWIFKKADTLVWVSNACKKFILSMSSSCLTRGSGWKVEVIYRWIEAPSKNEIVINNDLKKQFQWKIIVWFLWRLYKWKNVESLIKSYYKLDKNLKDKIQIVIVWDGEDLDRLKKLDKNNLAYFTWWKPLKEAIELQSQFDIHFHTSSPWWWLATTLLQAMKLWCYIVSTPYEWADEVIKNWENWIMLKNDSVVELKRWLEEWILNLGDKEKYSKINKEIIKNSFKWEENIKKYYKLFR